ncbi:MAG: 2,4-dihydroxyhept-2-ene-1,7-dioic acid aldolase [Pseudomonadales bacterium]|nr:2,4-dihydroxyhept-2-ene-1,7-dioic acid aldolase [Pseudomonadales bacterium]MCP5182667.1 2,4-dihydroxyhept-2-ene-1,7-dioic acid aldolase [Pseudomonadales bacterium]
MRENTALAAWRRNEQTIGCWLSVANAYTAEAIANIGFDWVCVDLQHGLIDYQDLTIMLPAISTTNTVPIVRVPWNEPYEIMKVLDAGALGVIVPMVNNRAEALQAVSACRYPPVGNRSFGPIRAALYGGKGYAQEANGQVACIVMIETREGIDNVEEIVTTPGLDGVYIGPSDLALALGMPPVGDQRTPEHRAVVERILKACRTHGVAAGIHTSSLEYTQEYLRLGFHFVTLASESQHMVQGAAQALARARGTQQEARENTGY